MKKICVYGSITTDMMIQLDNLPALGKSVEGRDFVNRAGGKGANQAVAAAQLGANVELISVVGYDTLGTNSLEKIRRRGVGTRYVGRYPCKTSFTLLFENLRDEDNEPSMILFSESNQYLGIEHLERSYAALDNAGILMIQLSVPLEGVVAAAKRMKDKDGIVILDPSPAKDVPDELLKCVDVITPNEKELPALSGMLNACENNELRQEAAEKLLKRGVKCVVNKVGADGAYIIDKAGMRHSPAMDVHVVSTWGVGSVFNGGLAVGLARDKDIDESIRFAQAASALTIMNGGSQDAVPSYEDCMDLLNGRYEFGLNENDL